MSTPFRVVGRAALERLWSEGRRIERTAVVVGAALFVSGLVHLAILVGSGGTWIGPVSMRKAVTFGLSFGLTLVTVASATSFIRMRGSARTLLLGALTVVSVLETGLITMQAWRGVPSHFNVETGFDTAVSMSLAVGGGVIILTAVGFTVAAVAARGMARGLRTAIRFGFASLLLSFAVGAVMIVTGVVTARGGQPQLAYDTAGFLKPLHAVAMHAILVVPGLAWLLSFSDWSPTRQLRLVWMAIAAYGGLIAVVGVEAAVGVSPLAAPWYAAVASLVALGTLTGCAAATAHALVRARRADSADRRPGGGPIVGI